MVLSHDAVFMRLNSSVQEVHYYACCSMWGATCNEVCKDDEAQSSVLMHSVGEVSK